MANSTQAWWPKHCGSRAGVSTYVVKSTGSQSYSFAGFTSILRRKTGVAEVGIGPIHIRTDPYAAMWLYDTGHKDERFIPAWKVLAGDTGGVKNAIVFVGTSAPGLLDLRSTPLAAPFRESRSMRRSSSRS